MRKDGVWMSNKLDDFTMGYISALFWSETIYDIDGNDNGSFQSEGYTPDDLAPGDLDKIISECRDFLEAHESRGRRILDLINKRYSPQYGDAGHGHDFLLTRNRHGAGFWDRGYKTLGRIATKHAQSYGEVHLILDPDTGVVHYES